MSIEKLIEGLTAAVEENTKQLAALAKATGAAPAKAATKKPTAAEKKAATEAAAAEMQAEDEKAAAKKTAAKKTAAKKSDKITKEALVGAFSGFLAEAQDDEDLLAERRTQVKAISTHYGLAKISELDPGSYSEAMEALSSYLAGETPAILDDGDSQEDEDDLV